MLQIGFHVSRNQIRTHFVTHAWQVWRLGGSCPQATRWHRCVGAGLYFCKQPLGLRVARPKGPWAWRPLLGRAAVLRCKVLAHRCPVGLLPGWRWPFLPLLRVLHSGSAWEAALLLWPFAEDAFQRASDRRPTGRQPLGVVAGVSPGGRVRPRTLRGSDESMWVAEIGWRRRFPGEGAEEGFAVETQERQQKLWLWAREPEDSSRWVPLLGAIARSHCLGAIVRCHCWVPLLVCHCWVPLWGAMAGCHCWCHCWVPLRETIARENWLECYTVLRCPFLCIDNTQKLACAIWGLCWYNFWPRWFSPLEFEDAPLPFGG